jgi:peptidoglycan/LPS O-acetylase OafA/YrhL
MLSRRTMAADVDEALRPPPGNPRFPLLDSARAVAALLIVVTHTAALSGFNLQNALGAYTARMNFGVTIFFLLSGFLLYRPFVAARREGRPAIRIRDFTRRRVLRIVPAYWVALALLSLYPGLSGFSEHWWRFFSFTQIYWFDSTITGLSPAWSLCIEATFYVILPFLAVAIGRLGISPRGEVAAILALAAASVGYRTILQAHGGPHTEQNTLLCYFDWFAYGMILATISVATHGREAQSRVLQSIVRRPWVPWALAAVAFWAISTQFQLPRGFFFVYTGWSYLGEHLGYALVSFLVLLPLVFGDWAGGWPRRLMALRPLPWLGLISYGIFLWHSPIMGKVNDHGAQNVVPGSTFLSLLIVTLGVSVPIAAASYYLVERPALKLKDSRRARRARSVSPAEPAAGPAG